MPSSTADTPRIYDEGAEELIHADAFPDRVSLLPGATSPLTPGDRIRVMWGQNMLRDVIDGRYRVVICGVNDQDNSHGIIAQLVSLITASQWSAASVTSYAHMFQESLAIHAHDDREPYVLKYDLDSVMVMALLRPAGRDHFTLKDIAHGFETITRMLQGRADRRPVASVSFLGAHSNQLLEPDGKEPAFETVLRTMFNAGYRGDVFPSPTLWRFGETGVFPSYPFPEGLDRMREGSS